MKFSILLPAALLAACLPFQEVRSDPHALDRRAARVIFFRFQEKDRTFRHDGQVCLEYGDPEWRKEYEERFDELTKGRRWRLGKDFWTTLDTDVPLRFGATRIAPGYYFLLLARSEEDRWSLVFADPAPIRGRRLDAFQAGEVPGGTEVTMTRRKAAESERRLTIRFITETTSPTRGTLEIRFGPHVLTTSFSAEV